MTVKICASKVKIKKKIKKTKKKPHIKISYLDAVRYFFYNKTLLSYLDIADCIYPTSPLGGAVGLESVRCHCTLEFIEVDEDERACRRHKT